MSQQSSEHSPLRDAAAATLTSTAATNVPTEVKRRAWLREASLHRMNMVLRNRKEIPDEASSADLCRELDLEQVQESGLTPEERRLLQRWMKGEDSGRQCMLGILEYRRVRAHIKGEDASGGNVSHGAAGCAPVPFHLMGTSINLPHQLFQDSGRLYNGLFSKAPNTVLKESLQSIAKVALEKGSHTLRTEQLNLALKQLRIEALRTADAPDSAAPADENDSRKASNVSASTLKPNHAGSGDLETLRLQIVTELIRIHLHDIAVAVGDVNKNSNVAEEDAAEEAVVTDPLELQRQRRELEELLGTPMATLAERLSTASLENIEEENAFLLTYIKQLSRMRGTLEVQLKDFESSRAFIGLGLTQDATSAQIKKAYHSKAIRLHPDKPGGDKDKFQKLQVMYEEVLRQRELEESMRTSKFPQAEEDAATAQSHLRNIEACVAKIKKSAATCGNIAQTNLRWLKRIDSAAELPHPRNVKILAKVIISAASDDAQAEEEDPLDITEPLEGKKKKSQKKIKLSDCSSYNLAPEVNSMCASLQDLLGVAVQFVSLGKYGKVASGKKAFLQLLEQAVTRGLNVSDQLTDIKRIESQVEDCVSRFTVMNAAKMFDDWWVDFKLGNVLTEMATTVFKSRSMTVNMIAELSVSVTVLAADILSSVEAIVRSVNAEVREEIRLASISSSTENEFCAEDLANLEKVRQQKMKEAQEEDVLRAKMHEERREEEKRQEEAAENIVEHLATKIHNLHVQLHLQYVQTLQKLNGDAITYQRKLLKELVKEFDVLDASSVGTDRNAAFTSEHSMSLLADLIDRSILGFRDEILTACSPRMNPFGAPITPGYVADSINRFFGWMLTETARKTSIKPSPLESESVETTSPADTAETPVNENPEAEDQAPARMRLAFFPDHRTRVLYLSSLLDRPSVKHVIENELQKRILEVIRDKSVQSTTFASNVTCLDAPIDSFCYTVMKGIDSLCAEVSS